MIVLLSLALWSSLHPCAAYMTLQDKIPNGHLVPDPCSLSGYWPGVGHQNSSGGGALNVFGAAFKTVGFEWGQVCPLDSDGDGRTNGEELGDPRCVWSPGQVPERSTNITHPGVCDPRDSYKCQVQNSFLSCTAYVSNQCAVLSEPGIRNITLAMKTLTVPQMEVSTLCMTFNLTFDKGYHLAAVEPVVNNNAMFHRAYLYACDEDISTVTAVAQSCGTLKSCGTLVTSWVVGQQTECYGQNFGLVLGATGYKILKMEVGQIVILFL
ncbi:uncharacterized protein LOC131955722 [Physella acuta]|uniref:uncharacterized protein LOC131955722 n=1 Tax=Physella acuta TaxID=109671 RepID=UPI0027DC23E1|nr:uncharacterized protein LOC131955722 [Physella acuta]